MRDFKDLVVWQKAHRLTLDVYRHEDLSNGGTVRPHRADSEIGCIGPDEHRRGVWA